MGIPIQIEPIGVDTPLGKGYAIFFESANDDNFWTIALNDSCAIVTFKQKDIRINRCYTYSRSITHKQMAEIIKRKHL